MFAHVESRLIFPTPIVLARLPEDTARTVNTELEQIILEKEKQSSGVKISNSGGWQSDTDILAWGGQPVRFLVDEIKSVLKKITWHLKGTTYSEVNVPWRIHGWANINRKGHANVMHTHPGSYWSASYYVKLPQPEYEDQIIGGELELLDPRGNLPLVYCPELRFALKNATSAGTSELHRPRVGEVIIFPSWLPHAVASHLSEDIRISIAMNFSV